MRASIRTRRGTGTLRAACLAVLTVTLVAVTGVVSLPASFADPRLEGAQEHREAQQERLDGLLGRIDGLEADISGVRAELDSLGDEERRHRAEADRAALRVERRVRAAYTYGQTDPTLSLLAADGIGEVSERTRVLAMLATRGRGEAEEALAARSRVEAGADRASELLADLRERREELEVAQKEAAGLVADAKDAEAEVKETIAREEAEERRRREEAERRRVATAQRASRGDAGGDDSGESGGDAGASDTASAPTSGGVACPVGRPHSFSDTYGAARSGGRSHMGTDILAARGIPIYAYEDGQISRMSSTRLGGISLWLRGDSGNSYYYTHLQGYVSGLSTGQRVSAGEQIAYNGDTGNARGIPHLHIEVMPGGGSNVNPYPFMRSACG